jgi:hypothetical protein
LSTQAVPSLPVVTVVEKLFGPVIENFAPGQRGCRGLARHLGDLTPSNLLA